MSHATEPASGGPRPAGGERAEGANGREGEAPAASPRIRSCSWGHVEVEGHGAFKDAKLWPGGARAWDWRETGTRHDPGIQPADVRELVERGARVVVLARGVHERLGVMPETLALLDERGVEAEVLPTGRAVERYNALAGEAPAGALIHSTC